MSDVRLVEEVNIRAWQINEINRLKMQLDVDVSLFLWGNMHYMKSRVPLRPSKSTLIYY